MRENQSIHRAFTILQAVAANSGEARVNAIAAQVRLPKSTVSRMLATLETLKAVERTSDGDAFMIGSELLALIQGTPYTRNLSALARPFLLELSQQTSEAVALCVQEGDEMQVVDLVQTRHLVQVEDSTGRRFPLHATSPGKVLLAFQSDSAINEYLSRSLVRFSPHTITDPEILRKHLSEIRQQGLAWVYQEFDNISGVSAPICDGIGQVVAAINLYGPAYRFPIEGTQGDISKLILETGRRLSERLALAAKTPGPPDASKSKSHSHKSRS